MLTLTEWKSRRRAEIRGRADRFCFELKREEILNGARADAVRARARARELEGQMSQLLGALETEYGPHMLKYAKCALGDLLAKEIVARLGKVIDFEMPEITEHLFREIQKRWGELALWGPHIDRVINQIMDAMDRQMRVRPSYDAAMASGDTLQIEHILVWPRGQEYHYISQFDMPLVRLTSRRRS